MGDETDPEIGLAEEEIVGGTLATPNPRTEIALVNGCTGTLIHPRFILSAAHCREYYDAFDVADTPCTNPFTIIQGDLGQAQFTQDGTLPGPGVCPTDPFESWWDVERIFNFGSVTGANDVSLVMLQGTVPSSVATPLGVATVYPSAGAAVTGWGYSAFDAPAFTTQFRNWSWGSQPWYVSNGDSGGPVIRAAAPAAIVGVHSLIANGTLGDPIQFQTQIASIITQWTGPVAGNDIGLTWCTAANEWLYYADINNDQQVDALCKNTVTGWLSWAVGENRMIRPVGSVSTTWCTHTGAEFHVGDFNADGRTDLLCYTRSTGSFDIDYATAPGNYQGTTDWFRHSTGWCNSSASRLMTGDFNGDGRADLLCHNTSTGIISIDYASTGAQFLGPDWTSSSAFCNSTANESLHTGVFNGDAYTDLLCHDSNTGGARLWLHTGNIFAPFNTTTAWNNPSWAFCTSAGGTRVVHAGDYDADGRTDLQCATVSGAIAATGQMSAFCKDPTLLFGPGPGALIGGCSGNNCGWPYGPGAMRMRVARPARDPWQRPLDRRVR